MHEQLADDTPVSEWEWDQNTHTVTLRMEKWECDSLGFEFEAEVMLSQQFSPEGRTPDLPLLHEHVQGTTCAVSVGNRPHVEGKQRLVAVYGVDLCHLWREDRR